MSSPFQPILKTLAILQVKQDLLIEKGQEKPSHHLPCSCRVAMEILTVVLCHGSLHWILTFRENCLVWQKGGSDFGYMATLIFSLTSTDSTFRLLSESFCQLPVIFCVDRRFCFFLLSWPPINYNLIQFDSYPLNLANVRQQ